MNQTEIKDKLEKLYTTPKSKGFVAHLVKSYYPYSKIKKLEENTEKKRLSCELTDSKLLTISDVMGSKQPEALKKSLSVDLSDVLYSKHEPTSFVKVMGGRLLGFTGEKTDTFLSFVAVTALVEWIEDKISNGDSHITFLTKKKSEKFVNSKTNKSGYRKPTSTFADLGVLQSLKEKMNK